MAGEITVVFTIGQTSPAPTRNLKNIIKVKCLLLEKSTIFDLLKYIIKTNCKLFS